MDHSIKMSLYFAFHDPLLPFVAGLGFLTVIPTRMHWLSQRVNGNSPQRATGKTHILQNRIDWSNYLQFGHCVPGLWRTPRLP